MRWRSGEGKGGFLGLVRGIWAVQGNGQSRVWNTAYREGARRTCQRPRMIRGASLVAHPSYPSTTALTSLNSLIGSFSTLQSSYLPVSLVLDERRIPIRNRTDVEFGILVLWLKEDVKDVCKHRDGLHRFLLRANMSEIHVSYCLWCRMYHGSEIFTVVGIRSVWGSETKRI